MKPLAPGLLSTITGCLVASPRYLATKRAARSVVVPAPNGTTILIGLLGKACACAKAVDAAANASVLPTSSRCSAFKSFIGSLLKGFLFASRSTGAALDHAQRVVGGNDFTTLVDHAVHRAH